MGPYHFILFTSYSQFWGEFFLFINNFWKNLGRCSLFIDNFGYHNYLEQFSRNFPFFTIYILAITCWESITIFLSSLGITWENVPFLFPTWNNLGIFSHFILKFKNNLGKCSFSILKSGNNLGKYYYVVLNLGINLGILPNLFSSLGITWGHFPILSSRLAITWANFLLCSHIWEKLGELFPVYSQSWE